ncbi:hypothetical protein [Actinoplanes sp. G11-F43]|uniref:hypothetical protein n=1 Tax=Actinoplanes sp. G11-F43 TaxID=3424130 RepID=UPI003D356E66
MDAGLKRALEAKVYAGERLTREDGVALFACDDLAWLGRLAHHRRTGATGDRVTFGPDAGEVTGRAELTDASAESGDRVDHLLGLRDRQDETGEFVFFVPLGTGAPAETLKTFAVSRLLFDNVPHVRSSPAEHGPSVAQLALSFGADDLEAVADAAEAEDDLLHLIWDAGFQPVRRDARYQVVREYEKAPSLAERRSEPQKIWA